MPKNAVSRLHDAAVHGQELIDFTTGKSMDGFLADRGLQLIVERLLEIVGEAFSQALQLDPSLIETFPEARQVIGMRNRIAHGYDRLIEETLWSTVVEHIPGLVARCRTYLDDHPVDE